MRLSIRIMKLTIIFCLIGLLPLWGRMPVARGTQLAALNQAPTAGPDLVIESVTLSPPNPGPGQLANITVVVKNQGDAATPDTAEFNVYLYINPTEVPPGKTTPYISLFTQGIPMAPQASFTWTRTDQVFPAANAKVYAYVDPAWENQVAESNENNNLYPNTTDPTPTPTPTATTPPSTSGDAYEEDDTCAQAKPITTDGAEQQHNLARTPSVDFDWVQFQGVANVTYFIEAAADGTDADLALALYPRCNAPSFGGGDKITFKVLSNGIYFVRARHKNDDYGPATNYRLKVTSDAGCTDNYETNDSCSAAGQLSLSSTQAHAFCKPNDTDWLTFPVTAGSKYRITTTNGGANVDVKLHPVANCSADQPNSLGNIFDFTATTTGVYYVEATNMKSSYGAGTNYTIQVQPISAAAGDSFEPDNSRESAKTLAVGATDQPRTFYPTGDEDWVKFTAQANITYTIETINLKASSDPVLCLVDGAGTQVLCDDDNGGGQGGRITWRAPQAGDYFVQTKNYQRDAAGDETAYQLRIQEGVCTPDGNEPDNSRDSARPLAADGTPQQHNFCPANDQDWVSFTVNANTPYLLETTDVGTEADTLVILYDAGGNELAKNDDHTPGGASQIAYTFAQAGAYYAKVMPYNGANFGNSASYRLRLQAGTPTPVPTLPPPATATATPTPQPSEGQSLILVNRAQIATLYSEADATQLMSKLDALAARPEVRGTIIDLNQNDTVRAAYSAWQSDPTSIDKANQVASAIRTLILNHWQAQGSLKYLVLVGDDRALPFYRIPDRTDIYPEKTYGETDKTHPTGAALYGNTYLSDDYYADKEPATVQGRPLYLPDLAVGRLIEAPSDMIRVIDAFLANPVTTLAAQDAVLVSGYDFVQDMATNVCKLWQTDYGTTGVTNCSLIGDTWLGANLRSAQTRTNQPYKIQVIAGHAAHWVEGAPNNDNFQAHELIAANGLDLSGALIYTPGCHAGLNVPPTDSSRALDLAQAFAGKGANYIGHTGYGWGHVYDIGWSEKLLQLYTQRLLKGQQASMGQSLSDAKQDYYRQSGTLDAFDEKILQTMIFYGLPMFGVKSGGAGALSGNDEFPGLEIGGAFRSGVIVRDYNLSATLNNAAVFAKADTAAGDYYALGRNRNTAKSAGEPVQPLFFYTETVPAGQSGRGIILRSATFRMENSFQPLIAAPYNEYSQQVNAAAVQSVWAANGNTDAWYPPLITDLRNDGNTTAVVAQIGQYQPASNQLRLYDRLAVEIFYNDSADQTPPAIHLVNGLYGRNPQVQVKVGATDASGIRQVTVAYINADDPNRLLSQDLTFDAAAQVWTGVFTGGPGTRFFVQVVDQAGNVTTAHNKGRYYTPGDGSARVLPPPPGCSGQCLFLPMVRR